MLPQLFPPALSSAASPEQLSTNTFPPELMGNNTSLLYSLCLCSQPDQLLRNKNKTHLQEHWEVGERSIQGVGETQGAHLFLDGSDLIQSNLIVS